MRSTTVCGFVVLCLLAVQNMALAATKRAALVIGNSAYKYTPELTNPRNDALDMAQTLESVGFRVLSGLDLDKAAFDRKIREFAASLAGAEVGLFFYAGHGLQVGGQNYLVPIDAELATTSALEFEMVRLDAVHRIMEREAQTNILFLDACRNNPLARNLARAMGTRSLDIGRGLAAVESGVGTLISFSTQPGNVALDGTGRNSPFAAALLRHISTSNDDLSALLISVRNDVMQATQRRQVPWEHSALTGRFHFKAANTGSPARSDQKPAPPSQWQSSEAERAWQLVKDTTHQAVLESFVKQFGDTVYGALARARLHELRKQQAAIPSPSRDGGSGCADLAGDWEHDTPTFPGRTSKWTLTRGPGSAYTANETGLGNVRSATATLSGNLLRIQFTLSGIAGYYQWYLDPNCTGGNGNLVFTAGLSGTHRSSVQRRP